MHRRHGPHVAARAFFLSVGVGVGVSAMAADARANGRYPAANQLLVAPSDPASWILRTTFGLLVSRDRGATWDWICERAVGYGANNEDPPLGITATGAIIAGTYEGLAVSQDGGCGWAFAGGGLAQNVVVDVVVRPDAPHVALALASKYAATGDAGSTYASQLFESDNDGASWAPLGAPLDPTVAFETVEVAASDPARIYLSGYRGGVPNPAGVLFVSKDTGKTWDEHPIALIAALEQAPFIAAVDPTSADRVYVRTTGSRFTDAGTFAATSRLLVTSDAGGTFVEKYSGGALSGFALSTDGSTLFFGGPTDGLWTGKSTDLTFLQTSTLPVQCLRTSGASLWICSSDVRGFTVGETLDNGATITPKLRLGEIRGPLACPASASAGVCASDWPALRDQLGIGSVVATDGGLPDAGAPAAASSKSCTCDAAGMGGETRTEGYAMACALGLLCAWGRAPRRGSPGGARKRRR